MQGFMRYFVIGIAVLAIGLGMVVALLPTVASTSWGNSLVISAINGTIPGSFQMERVSLGWLGNQKIQKLSLKDPEGNPVFSIDSLTIDTPLFVLMTKGILGSSASVEGLNLDIQNTPSGLTNLDESLGTSIIGVKLSATGSMSLKEVHASVVGGNGSFAIKAEGKTAQNNIPGAFRVNGEWDGSRMNWDADVKGFPVRLLDAMVASQSSEMSGLICHLLGDSLSIQANEISKSDARFWHVKVLSDKLHLEGEAHLDPEEVSLASPAEASLKITPELLQRFAVYFPELQDWTLPATSELTLKIDKLRIPTQFFSPLYLYGKKNDVQMQASLSLADGKIVSVRNHKDEIAIKDLMINLETDDQSNWLLLTVDGKYLQDKIPLSYRLETRLNKPAHISKISQSLLQPAELEFAFDRISTKLLSQLLGLQESSFETAFGEHVSVRMKASGKNSKSMKMSIISDKLDIPEIDLTVDQDLFLSNLEKSQGISGKIKIEKMIFKSEGSRSVVHSLSIPWQISSGFGSLQLSVKGKTAIPSFEEGKIVGKVEVEGLSSLKAGKWNVHFEGTSVPSALLEVATGRNEIESVFGRHLDFDVSVNLDHLNGEIKSSLTGENGNLSLDSQIQEGILTLRSPFKIELKGTPELGRDVLSRFVPIFGDFLYSDHTMTATISPDNFSLPLFPFNLEAVSMEKAEISMGKLRFNRAGDIKRLLEVLRASPTEQVSIWTTPIYLSLQKGALQVYRTDILVADQYPIASWGKVDLAADKVNMVVGLTGEALARAFNLQNLDREVMIQIPIKGSTKSASISSTKVTSKISSLIAKEQGGAKGLILGTVLDLANGKEEKVPAPTTSPLPWAGKEFSHDGEIKHRPSEPRESTKGIKKEASKLIKNFFH